MAELLTDRAISHDEAREIAQRLINSAFRNDSDQARFRIPADREHDDDLLMMAYIHQQRTKDGDQGKHIVPNFNAVPLNRGH